jgi:tRNA (guanine-N7-)-methyltransferase
VFTAELVVEAARTLVPGGTLRLATDVEEYFHLMTSLVAEVPSFAQLDESGVELPEGECLTSFERKYRAEGRSIFRVAYRRIEAIANPAPSES